MKKLAFSLIIYSLLGFSLSASAERVIITSQPIMLEKQGTVYYVPSGAVAPTTDYYYVNLDNSNRVCYLQQPSSLAGVNAEVVSVNIGGTVQQMHCYTTDPTYFQVGP